MQKVNYSINLLPQLTEEEGDLNLMRLLTNTSQMDIFDLEHIKALIDFKWSLVSGIHFTLFISLIC